MGDARVPAAVIMDAFGLAIAVTRPAPDDVDTVTTSGAWLPVVGQFTALSEVQPYGTDLHRADPRRVMAIPRSGVLPNAPRGTLVVAAEEEGLPAKAWKVEGYEGPVESDLMRVILKRTADWSE